MGIAARSRRGVTGRADPSPVGRDGDQSVVTVHLTRACEQVGRLVDHWV